MGLIEMGKDKARRRAGWERERQRAGLGNGQDKGCRKTAATVLVLLAGTAAGAAYGTIELARALIALGS
jgi:hypothetical protein